MGKGTSTGTLSPILIFRTALLLYNGGAFDSCFPLRDQKGGLRESIRTPLFRFQAADASWVHFSSVEEEGI